MVASSPRTMIVKRGVRFVPNAVVTAGRHWIPLVSAFAHGATGPTTGPTGSRIFGAA